MFHLREVTSLNWNIRPNTSLLQTPGTEEKKKRATSGVITLNSNENKYMTQTSTHDLHCLPRFLFSPQYCRERLPGMLQSKAQRLYFKHNTSIL
jgi:hypothetical protein